MLSPEVFKAYDVRGIVPDELDAAGAEALARGYVAAFEPRGMAGPMIGPVLERLPVTASAHHFDPDGRFPSHEPNPLLEENRRFIVEQVQREGADLGIAWDGDADRCFFVDDTGEFVPGDLIT